VVRKPEPGANEELAPNPVDFPTIVCSLPCRQLWEGLKGALGLRQRCYAESVTLSLVNDVTG
jgi:hypothetical protein